MKDARVHFYAGSQSHFVNHLFPIYNHFAPYLRGEFIVRPGTDAEARCRELGINWTKVHPVERNQLVVVASYEDYRHMRVARIIFYSHGVGQRYNGDPKTAYLSAYTGGPNRDRTALFLGPSEHDAEASRLAYPRIPSVSLKGVPYLDTIERNPSGAVVISFHANINACPETRWAWDHFRPAVEQLAASKEFNLIGHCHPRARRQLAPWFSRIGIPFEPNLLKLLPIASCYVIDNSSSGYEMAALGVPTVWMNAPCYRRHVNHGLRFWDLIPGVQVDNPADLASAINLALSDPPDLVERRERAITTAYDGPLDGYATERATEAIWTLATHGSEMLAKHCLTTSPVS